MASTFSTIAIVALILGVIFLIAAAVIFIKLKIWVVMADLSGKTAQLSIEQLRSQNGAPAKRTQHRSYVVNSSVLKKNKGTDELRQNSTMHIGKSMSKKTDVLKNDNETVPLKHDNRTEKLTEDTAILDEGTVILKEKSDSEGTAVLVEGTTILGDGTTLLQSDATTVINESEKTPSGFRIITDIMMIHTDETIAMGNN